jgi:hypothetical protein
MSLTGEGASPTKGGVSACVSCSLTTSFVCSREISATSSVIAELAFSLQSYHRRTETPKQRLIMATDASETAVDSTPISPTQSRPERRNSLEKHLQQRPEAQDLKNRNILLDTNAAP